MIVCPDCLGNKQCGCTASVCGIETTCAWYKCVRCAGTGEVDPERDRWFIFGAAHRRRRIADKETVREAAARYGFTLAQLCDIENGRADGLRLIGQAAIRMEAS